MAVTILQTVKMTCDPHAAVYSMTRAIRDTLEAQDLLF